jgi:hypothetical protein
VLIVVITLGLLASSPVSPLAGWIATVSEAVGFRSVIAAINLTSTAIAHVVLGL